MSVRTKRYQHSSYYERVSGRDGTEFGTRYFFWTVYSRVPRKLMFLIVTLDDSVQYLAGLGHAPGVE